MYLLYVIINNNNNTSLRFDGRDVCDESVNSFVMINFLYAAMLRRCQLLFCGIVFFILIISLLKTTYYKVLTEFNLTETLLALIMSYVHSNVESSVNYYPSKIKLILYLTYNKNKHHTGHRLACLGLGLALPRMQGSRHLLSTRQQTPSHQRVENRNHQKRQRVVNHCFRQCHPSAIKKNENTKGNKINRYGNVTLISKYWQLR